MGTLGIFLQYSDPRPPPLLSHGALISTDQAFTLLKMRAVCFHMHIGLNAKKKKTKELYLQTSVSQPLQGLF